jgi:hypothetical protein
LHTHSTFGHLFHVTHNQQQHQTIELIFMQVLCGIAFFRKCMKEMHPNGVTIYAKKKKFMFMKKFAEL